MTAGSAPAGDREARPAHDLEARPVGDRGNRTLRLLVLGDSTSFTDAVGPQAPDHPGLYPNLVARHLEVALRQTVEVTVVARAGQTVRDAARAITKDRHLQFDLAAHADALIVGVGSFDHAPAGVPASVEAVVPYLRPAILRRRVRAGLRWAYPRLVRATGGSRPRTPAREFERLFGQLLDELRWWTQGRAAGVVIGPTSHRAAYYGHRHPGHGRAEQRHLALAATHGFAGISSWDRVRPHVRELNPDGIHWPAAAHRAVAADAATALRRQLTGEEPRIGRPGSPPPVLPAR